MSKTPSQRWNEEIFRYKQKCQSILNSSGSIRYVGLINQHGRTLTGIIRPGTNILLKSEQARNEFFLVSTLFNMRNRVDVAIGKMDYALFKHTKVTLVVFQTKEGLYYVSLGKNAATDTVLKVIARIKKIV